jgi:hypothetical protein
MSSIRVTMQNCEAMGAKMARKVALSRRYLLEETARLFKNLK